MIFGEWQRWLNNLSRNTRGRAAGRKKARSARPGLEVFERRDVPAVVYVDNLSDYFISNDQGAVGLDNGDIVTWNAGAGSAHGGSVSDLIFGISAFGTIQSAVNAAAAGDTIRVAAGTFVEAVNVNKQLTLLGNQFDVDARTSRGPESVVDDSANGGRTPFYVTASGVELNGFTVQGQTNVNQFGAGIVLGAGTSGSEVRNNIIQDNVVGIFLANNSTTDQTVIERNLIRDNDNPGAASGTGIYTDQSVSGPTLTNVLIQDNLFTGANFTLGLNLQNATNATITNNAFEGGNAARLANVDDSSFTNNVFSGALVNPPSGFQVTGLNVTSVSGNGSNNVTISGNTFTNRQASAISVSGRSGNLTLTNNTVTQDVSLFAANTNRAMISLTGLAGTNNITGNTITLTGTMPSGAGVNGFAVQGNFTEVVNVSGNTIIGGNTDTFTGTNDSHGIGIFGSGLGLPGTPTPVFSTVNVTNNFITGWVDGIALPNSHNSRVTININSNSIAANSHAGLVAANDIGAVNAENNWWGSASGPTAASNPGGTGDAIIDPAGRVDYSPWLTTGADVSADSGFQGDFAQITVNAGSPKNSGQTVGNLQEGIDQVTVGGTVTAMAGTYDLSAGVTIDKSLTLLGAKQGVAGTDASRGTGESVLNGPASQTPGAFTFNTPGPVTLNGFTFNGSHIASGQPAGIDLRFLNNVFNLQAMTTGNSMILSNPQRLTLTNNKFTTTGSNLNGSGVIQVEGNYAGTGTANFMDVTGNTFLGIPDANNRRTLQLTFNNVQGNVQDNVFDGVDVGVLVAGTSGNLTISGNTFQNITRGAAQIAAGSFGAGVVFYNPTLSGPVTLSNNTFQNSDTGFRTSFGGGGPFTLNSPTVGITGNIFTGNVFNIVDKFAGTLTLDGDNVFDGVTLSSATTVQLFAIADKIVDAIDVSGYGLVRLKAGNVYVTPNSYFSPTTTPSIQRGIDAATAGDTVNVAAGTYLESVTVNKPVTVQGAQAGLNPTGRTNPAMESIVSAPSGTDGFSISADNVTVRGFTVTTVGGRYGIYEATQVTGTVIDRNIVSGFAGSGISLADGSSGAEVSENDVSNNYAGIHLSTGAKNVTVRANVVHDNVGTGLDAGSGIVFEGNNTNVLVTQNFIRDNAGAGIYVWDGFGNDFSSTTFTSNSITGNGVGFNDTNTGAADFDAAGNWWGTHTAAGVAAEINGDVDFTPFLLTGVDTSAASGFQGDASVAPGEGNVRVKVIGGQLIIRGGNLDNLITVEKVPNEKSYRVTGLAGTQINGQSGSFVFENVTRGIDAHLAGGDDMLVFDGSVSPFEVLGAIKVRTGRGDDLVRFQGVSVSGKSDLSSWSGKDLVQLIDSDFNGLAVNMGHGKSTSLELDGVTVNGRTAVRGGNGADTVRVVDSNLAAALIHTGFGNDSISLERVHATGRVQVEAGRHTDKVAVTYSTFDAAVVLGGSFGNDDKLDAGTLDTPNSNGNAFVFGPVTRGFEDVLS